MFPFSPEKTAFWNGGHTEATVDLMRLAGLKECGLCCEIMRDDGTMMRTPELTALSTKFDLKFITIKSLQDYRKKTTSWSNVSPILSFTKYAISRRTVMSKSSTENIMWRLSRATSATEKIFCVQVHSECLTGDAFGSCALTAVNNLPPP